MSKDKQDAIDNKQSYLLVEIEQGRIKVKGPQNFLNCLYNNTHTQHVLSVILLFFQNKNLPTCLTRKNTRKYTKECINKIFDFIKFKVELQLNLYTTRNIL